MGDPTSHEARIDALTAERDALKAALESTTRADDKIQNYAAAEIKLLRANVARLAANQPYTCESHKDEAGKDGFRTCGACHWCQLDALKAEVFQAKAIAEHWQKRTEQTEKERAEFRDEVARLEGACDKCDLSVMRDTIVRLRALLSRCHGSVGLALNHGLVRRDLLSDLDAELENPVPAVPPCTHNWVRADNEVVTGCEICTKCGALRAAQARSLITNDINRWHRDKGESVLKFDFPLSPDSLVYDIGAYTGLWSEEISKRYGCLIHAFEPVKKFYDRAVEILKAHPRVRVHNFGLWTETATMTVGVNDESSGIFAANVPVELCDFLSLAEFMEATGPVDLLTMNCEGSEYDLLDDAVSRGFIRNVRFLLVQFHKIDGVKDFERRYERIRDALLLTHNVKWRYPFTWECWERKGAPDVSPVPALQAGVPKAGPDAGLDDRDRDPAPDGM